MRMKVTGLKKMTDQLNKIARSKRYAPACTLVGYGGSPPSENYAVYVHENAPSPPENKNYTKKGSGHNFLRGPALEMAPLLSREVVDLMKSGRTLSQAIYSMGVRLKKSSLARVPVDSGALRDSAVARRIV